MSDFFASRWQRRLDRLAARHQLRQPPDPVPAGLIDVSHNDYLSLIPTISQVPYSLPAASGGSRLLGGQHPIYAELEDAFTQFKGGEASLLFGSGFAANEAVIHGLNLPGVSFFYDEFSHASIIDGLKLAKVPSHRKTAFRHQDLAHLDRLLTASKAEAQVVIVESVYSMDGDMVDIGGLLAVCRRHGALVVVDEAHALGVYGPGGRGLAPAAADIITVNPCGKGLASMGAFITGPLTFKNYLINTARSFIYTTALPPSHCERLLKTIALVQAADDRRQHLTEMSAELRQLLAGVNTLAAKSHIIPVVCGSAAKATQLAAELAKAGFYARAIRFPTVAKGSERVRVSLNASLSTKDIRQLAFAIKAALA